MTTRQSTLRKKSNAQAVPPTATRRIVDLESILKPRPEAEIRREIEAKARERFAPLT